MRRVNIRNGLLQRMNEILGTDSGVVNDSGNMPGITGWSIQAAMITNMQRIVQALVGDSTRGRPIKGLQLGYTAGLNFTISSGLGLTNSGNIVVMANNIWQTIPSSSNASVHIFLKHIIGEVTQALNPTSGKKSNFINKTSEEIVYDDLGATSATDVLGTATQIIIQSTTNNMPSDDCVYLGYVTISGGMISSVTNTYNKGITDDTGSVNLNGVTAQNITSQIGITSNGTITINGPVVVAGGTNPGITENITIAVGNKLEFTNGILTKFSVS